MNSLRKYSTLICLIFLFVVLIGPLLILLESWFYPSDKAWQFFLDEELSDALVTTSLFSVGTVLLSLILGVYCAYITSFFDFKGRFFYEWALILPLAMPAYILGFVYLGLFEPTGAINSVLKNMGFTPLSMSIKNIFGAICFKALTLYPYIYLMAKSAFASQSKHVIEAAKVSGASNSIIIWKIILPLAWPWLFGGMSLVFMESLADFGMVKLFNVETLTTIVYSKWASEQSLSSAERISFLLLVFLLAFVLIKNFVIGAKKSYISVKEGASYSERKKISFTSQLYIHLSLGLILLLAFILPLMLIFSWAYKDFQVTEFKNWIAFLPYSINSFLLSIFSALIVTAIALFVAVNNRFEKKRWIHLAKRFSTVGYALPGTLLGIGVFAFLLNADRLFGLTNFFTTSIIGLILGYIIRFYAVADESVDNGFERLSPSLDESAKLCGKKPTQIVGAIHLPLLKVGLVTSVIMVFVDVMKELPLTLMMRPYGWDTLPIRIYNYTAEGEWVKAAFPALLLVLVSIIPVIVLTRFSNRKKIS